MDTLFEVALFFEEIHKVFKNKVQGCRTPLSQFLEFVCYSRFYFYRSRLNIKTFSLNFQSLWEPTCKYELNKPYLFPSYGIHTNTDIYVLARLPYHMYLFHFPLIGGGSQGMSQHKSNINTQCLRQIFIKEIWKLPCLYIPHGIMKRNCFF